MPLTFDLLHGLKTLAFCGEQRMVSWKREKLMFQSLDADEGTEPQAFILRISIGSGKLCKREAAYVSYLGNIHGAPSDHGITQVCWDFGGWGGILSVLQTTPHENIRAEIHLSAVLSHCWTERGRKGTSPLSICGCKMEQGSFYRMQKEREVAWQK